MEMWELIKHLLAGAVGGGQSFSPELIASSLHRRLTRAGHVVNQSVLEAQDASVYLAEQMQEAGLIRAAGVRGGGIAIINAMERTEFGDELYESLERGATVLFEAMHVEVDSGEIRRVLHQWNS